MNRSLKPDFYSGPSMPSTPRSAGSPTENPYLLADLAGTATSSAERIKARWSKLSPAPTRDIPILIGDSERARHLGSVLDRWGTEVGGIAGDRAVRRFEDVGCSPLPVQKPPLSRSSDEGRVDPRSTSCWSEPRLGQQLSTCRCSRGIVSR